MPEKKGSTPPPSDVVGIDKESGKPISREELLRLGFTPEKPGARSDVFPFEETAGHTELHPIAGVLNLRPEQEVTRRLNEDKLVDIVGDEPLTPPYTPRSEEEERWDKMTGQDEEGVAKQLNAIEGDEPLDEEELEDLEPLPEDEEE